MIKEHFALSFYRVPFHGDFVRIFSSQHLTYYLCEIPCLFVIIYWCNWNKNMQSGLSGSLDVGINFESIKQVLQLICYVHRGFESLLIIFGLAARLLPA